MESISIIGQDHIGFVANITELLEANQVNITDINAEFYGDMAVCQLKTCDDQRTLSLLRDNGYRVSTKRRLKIKIPNQSGTLAKVARVLTQNMINIKSMNHVSKTEHYSVIAITTSNDDKARELIADFLAR